MGTVVQMLLLCGRWLFWPTVDNARLQYYRTDPLNAPLVLGHLANRFALVTLDLKTVLTGETEVPKHMATGDGGYIGFFRVYVNWV